MTSCTSFLFNFTIEEMTVDSFYSISDYSSYTTLNITHSLIHSLSVITFLLLIHLQRIWSGDTVV